MITAGWLTLPAMAEEAAGSPWELTAAGALSVADGNSESVAYSVQLLASYLKDRNAAHLGLDYFYAENDGQRSTDSLKLHEQLNRTLNDDWYLSQYGSALKDEVAGIDHRIDFSALLGLKVLRRERVKLTVEAGPGYAWEQQGEIGSDFMTARLAQHCEWQLSANAKLWQSFGWTPRVDDVSDSLIELDVGLESRINSTLALRTFVRHRIDSSPAANSSKEDTALMIGLSYDLGGVKQPTMSTDGSASRRSLFKKSTASAAAPTIEGWETTAAFGAGLNKGNSDKLGMTLGWDSDYTSEVRDFAWEIDYVHSEDNGQTSTDRLSSRLQSNHYLDGPTYLGGAIGYLRDELADIDYRLTPGVLVGHALVKNDTTRLALEAGPTMTFEQTGGQSNQFASLRLAERWRHRFNSQYAVKQSIEAIGALEDPENYTLVAAVSLDTRLTGNWLWRVSAECHYDNQPAAERDHRDLLLTSSVAIRF